MILIMPSTRQKKRFRFEPFLGTMRAYYDRSSIVTYGFPFFAHRTFFQRFSKFVGSNTFEIFWMKFADYRYVLLPRVFSIYEHFMRFNNSIMITTAFVRCRENRSGFTRAFACFGQIFNFITPKAEEMTVF